MSDSNETIDRREFLGKSAALIAGGAALPSTALSYGRIVGANDRISLAHIGTGSRGSGPQPHRRSTGCATPVRDRIGRGDRAPKRREGLLA